MLAHYILSFIFNLFLYRLRQSFYLQLLPFSSGLELQHQMLDLRFQVERYFFFPASCVIIPINVVIDLVVTEYSIVNKDFHGCSCC